MRSARRSGWAPGATRLCAYAAALQRAAATGARGRSDGEARAFLAPLPVGLLRERLDDEWEPGAISRQARAPRGRDPRRSWRRFPTPRSPTASGGGARGAADGARRRGAAAAPPRPRGAWSSAWSCARRSRARSWSGSWRCWSIACSPTRRAGGRSLRRLRLAARLAGGGGWRAEAALRQASADHERLLLALLPKLDGASRPRRLADPARAGDGPAGGRPGGARLPARPRAGAGGWPRRFARRARSPGRTRCCGCSRSTSTRGCRSGARC